MIHDNVYYNYRRVVMTKRILDCSASDLAGYNAGQLLEAIAGSEGRVIAGEYRDYAASVYGYYQRRGRGGYGGGHFAAQYV